jgi:asparagine synthase (glutamine-hydrolysing)
VSDFLLDLRPERQRALPRAAESLRFADGTRAVLFNLPGFGLAATHHGDAGLWAPWCANDGSFAVVAGRPVFDEDNWSAERAPDGSGGLAAGVVYTRYRETGPASLERLNGNFAAVLCDQERQRLYLVTDCCGVYPVFVCDTPDGPVYGSHPDVLADAANERHRVDEGSLAEFILSGTVTPPFSYYERIRAAGHGTVFSFDLSQAPPARASARKYFEFVYRGDPRVREDELAHDLAAAVKRAVDRRTLSRLGPTAIALSGGLDSRVILATATGGARTFAFTCYDEPNREMRTAEAIARALSAPYLPLRREPDYYADHAERGVRISGGMGSLANNHFLGVIPRLEQEGMASLLTGCYCDYLLKGLPLNRRVDRFTRRERIAPFRHQFYFNHFPASSPLAERARERWESRVPREFQAQDTPAAVFQVEVRRTFPLCYEGDNQQRLVPQRLTGWCPPFVDREVMDLYCRLPYHFKLNRSVFLKVVTALTPESAGVRDANTGASPEASAGRELLHVNLLRLQRRWQRLRASGSSDESWPNWHHYVMHSPTLDRLWNRPNPDATDLFRRVLGPSGLPDDEALKRDHTFLFVGLLTLKLWLDQRR